MVIGGLKDASGCIEISVRRNFLKKYSLNVAISIIIVLQLVAAIHDHFIGDLSYYRHLDERDKVPLVASFFLIAPHNALSGCPT